MEFKRGYLLFLLATFFAISITIAAEDNSGLTGLITSHPLNVSISIVSAPPSLNIIYPKNGTYLTNESILLTYSASGQQAVWFNLDNGENITLSSTAFRFNTSEGSHLVTIFANSSDGFLTNESIRFMVNTTLFIIYYDDFAGQGDTTELIDFTYEEIQSFDNLILENEYGRIAYTSAVNLTNVPIGNILDIDSNVSITLNRIEVKSNILQNLNKSASNNLYQLTFSSQPQVLRNSVLCSAPFCQVSSYNAGDLQFSVQGFTIYSANETITTVPDDSGNDHRGGSGGTELPVTSPVIEEDYGVRYFTINPSKISVSLRETETLVKQVEIVNLLNETIIVDLRVENILNPYLDNIIKLESDSLLIFPGESVFVNLSFDAGRNIPPGSYMGKLVASYKGKTESSLIIVDLSSLQKLIDIRIDFPHVDKTIFIDENLLAKIGLFSLGPTEEINADLEYVIKDLEGNQILTSSENISFTSDIDLWKEFDLPQSIKPGEYILEATAKYQGSVTVVTANFFISDKKKPLWDKIAIWIFLLIILILAIIFIKRIAEKKKIDNIKKEFLKKETQSRQKAIGDITRKHKL